MTMGVAFLLNLLSSVPGTVVYHLLVALGLLTALGIVWSEWKQTGEQARFATLLALALVIVFHGVAILLAPLHVDTTGALALVTAPYLYSVELISVLLLLWAFGYPLWRDKLRMLLLILLGWGVLLAVLTVAWIGQARAFPIFYTDSWQMPLWYLLTVVAAAAAILRLLPRREEVGGWFAIVAFALIGVGSALGILASRFLEAPLPGGEGIGRMLILFGYPLFAIGLYRAALDDLNLYRHELLQLSDQALRQRQELLFLIEATRAIGERIRLRGMLGEVVEHVAMALQADRVAIFILEEGGRRLALEAQYEVLRRQYSPSLTVDLDEHPILRTAMKQPIIYRTQEDFRPLRPFFRLLDAEEGPFIIQPLKRQKKTVGFLVACNDHSRQPFSPEKVELAATIGVQIAGAVENSRLYREVQENARKLQQHLRQRMNELRQREAIFASMSEGLLVSDHRGKVMIANRAAAEILGMEIEAIEGHFVVDLMEHVVWEPPFTAETLLSITQPVQTRFDFRDRKVSVHAAPVALEDGTRLGIVAVLQDVTGEYRAEEAKRQFIAGISHELRTPLTAIKGYSEIILAGMVGEPPKGMLDFVEVIHGNALRMQFITDNLIAVAEIEEGRVGLNYQSVDLTALIESVIREYAPRIRERRIDLTMDIAPDLPAVDADPNRMRQVLSNLVDNAVKYTYPNGMIAIGARVIHDSMDKEAFVSFWIADSGVGVREEDRPHIWDRFYRGENPLSLEAGGLGIGLHIVKSFIEAHGGRVWIDSIEGKGATFTFLLPTERYQNPHWKENG